MLARELWKYIPDVVAFIIATALGCVALLPAPKNPQKTHWLKVVAIVFCMVVAVGACVASMKLKYDAAEAARQDHEHAMANETHALQNEAELKKQLAAMELVINDDIRTKAEHPVILAAYGAPDVPTVGKPLAMNVNFVLTGSKDAAFSSKTGWEVLFIDEDVTAYPNTERKTAEEGIWNRMAARDPLTLHIPYGKDGTATVPLYTAPLTPEQVNALINGRALAYFMEELRNPTTNKVVLSLCKFLDSRGEISGCFEHDRTDAER